jgi:acetyl-CoA synthetase
MTDINVLEHQPIAWTPTPEVIERAQLTKFMRQVGVSTWDELYQFSIRDVENFTEEVLKFLDIKFDPPYEKLLDVSDGIEFPKWFQRNADSPRNADAPVRTDASASASFLAASGDAGDGARVPTAGLNITTMCLDRWQTDEMKNKPAVIFESEEDFDRIPTWHDLTLLTYLDLFQWTEWIAAGLRAFGIGKGDAVGIYLPMMHETVISLLAINRIGAIAVPVFSGYGVEAIAARMNAVNAKALITCNGFPRRGKLFHSFSLALEAAEKSPSIQKVFVVQRVKGDLNLPDDRFIVWTQISAHGQRVAREIPSNYEAEPTSAEDPLIILYISRLRPRRIWRSVAMWAAAHASAGIRTSAG